MALSAKRLRHDDRTTGGPDGRRVWIGITGKLLPFKYYGAKENAQAFGYGMSESRLHNRTRFASTSSNVAG